MSNMRSILVEKQVAVSTVRLDGRPGVYGYDHCGNPLVWETAICEFPGWTELHLERFSNEKEALECHQRFLDRVTHVSYRRL
jgi:hypothetical protein